MQEEGWLALDEHIEHVDGVFGTMECLLCFEAWLDQHHFWEIGDPHGKTTEAENAIAAFMELVKKYLPRDKGNGWNVSKFHELKHLVRFIEAFGSPRGYNASRPEEHHKAHAKRPAHRARWSMETIDQQCARRIADTFVIDTIHSLLVGDKDSSGQVWEQGTISTTTTATATATASTSVTDVICLTREDGGGTRYDVRSFRDPENNMNLRRDVIWKTQTRGDMNLEPNLAMFILQSYDTDLDANGEGSISCCTEYIKFETASKDKMIHVRCHPNYRSSGKGWYDWAYIRFEDPDGESSTDYPSKILSCIPRHRDMARIPLISSSNAVAMQHSMNPSSSQSGLSSPTSMLLRHPPLSPCALSFPAHQMGQRSLLSGTGPIGHHSFVMLPTFGMTRI